MKKIEVLETKLEACPTGPGVYLMKNEAGHVLYVGKAKNLKSRVRSYFQKQAQHSAKTLYLVEQIRDIEYLRTATEVEALLLENNLIKKWKPKYNIRLKDDKTYPYLRLGMDHAFPRPYVARKQLHGDGSEYFGPFPNGMALRETLKLAAKVFLLRDCRDHEFANRSRPCLSYQIGQCTAPCVGYVSQAEYAQQVTEYKSFIEGNSTQLEERWEREMEEASEKMEFEKAARLRDRLVHIRAVVGQEQRMVDTLDATDRDVWAFWPPASEGGVGASVLRSSDTEYSSSPAPCPQASSDAGSPSGEEISANPAELADAPRDEWEEGVRTLEDINGDLEEEATPNEMLDILILQFRGGKWVGRVHRTAELAARVETEDFLANLLLQHYAKHPLPTQVLLPERATSDDAAFSEALRQVAGVEEAPDLRLVSERGEWARLGELALENVRGMHADEEAVRARSRDGLEAIARMLELEKAPERLECVDISNIQGEANVASCVVFTQGRPDKNEYRHYNIAGFEGQNDFASMREVMARRYGKPDSPRPDLLVIDGGKGQLASAVAVLESLGCKFPVVGLAKARTKRNFRSQEVESSEERIFLPNQKNPLVIKNAQAFQILTQLRNEAHRFAITFHRQKRSRARDLT